MITLNCGGLLFGPAFSKPSHHPLDLNTYALPWHFSPFFLFSNTATIHKKPILPKLENIVVLENLSEQRVMVSRLQDQPGMNELLFYQIIFQNLQNTIHPSQIKLLWWISLIVSASSRNLAQLNTFLPVMPLQLWTTQKSRYQWLSTSAWFQSNFWILILVFCFF